MFAVAGTVVVGGLTAREFGGARRAQLLAAIAIHLAAIFGTVLLAAALLGPARRTSADRRLLAGAVIAVLLMLPDLWWRRGTAGPCSR
ncbi:hypothetical protein ACIPSA_27790 [Streptomyces sp. NPDC086549]|uniref:hypothetical protein n=1 Tax=Streptomyces sp. NPDC086549 TaxID=3365752 RepID=UPI0037F3DC24